MIRFFYIYRRFADGPNLLILWCLRGSYFIFWCLIWRWFKFVGILMVTWLPWSEFVDTLMVDVATIRICWCFMINMAMIQTGWYFDVWYGGSFFSDAWWNSLHEAGGQPKNRATPRTKQIQFKFIFQDKLHFIRLE